MDALVEVLEAGGVDRRALAAQEHLLAAGLQLGGEPVGAHDRVPGDALDAAGRVPVQGGEHLAAAGVDDRADRAGRVPMGEREQVEA